MWSRIGLYYCLWLQIGGTLTKRGSRNDAQGARPTAEFYTIEPEVCGVSPERGLAERGSGTAPLVEEFGV